MENILFKYSEFFEDDGGFKKVLADFDVLGEALVSKAAAYKKEINEAFGTLNIDAMVKAEKGIQDVSKEFKELAEVKTQLAALEKQYIDVLKQVKKGSDDVGQSTNKRTREEVLLAREVQARADAEIKKNGQLFSVYTRTQGKLTGLIQTYRDMLLKQELGISLNAKEIAQLGTIEQRVQKYDAAMKKVDAQTGRFTRNVGNYSSAYNGLGNSINQITRELPAFTFSTQTGILALSNNIPILTDEIGRLNKANEELRAQGKPVKSVLTSIAEGVFSLQTAMGVGILILTLYGDKIVKSIENWFDGSKALAEQKKWLDETNKALEARGKIISEGSAFEEQVIRNFEEQTNRIIRLRNAMGQNEQKNAIEERFFNLNRIKTYKKSTEDEIALREKLEKDRQDKYVKELERLKGLKKAEFDRANLNKSGKRVGLSVFAEDVDGLSPAEIATRANKRISDLKRSAYYAQEINKKELEELKKQKTALIVSEQQYTDELKILQEQQATDRLKALKQLQEQRKVSGFELKKFLIEQEVETNEEIFASDKYTADRRIEAQKALVAALKKLAGAEKTEGLRALRQKYNDEVKEVKKNADGSIVTQEYVNATLLELQKKFNKDAALINEQYKAAIIKANEKGEDLGVLFRLEAQQAYFQKQQKLVSETTKEWENYQIAISKAKFLIEQLTDKPQSDFLGDNLETSRKELVEYVDFVKKVQGQLAGRKFTSLSKGQRAKLLKEVEKLEKEQQAITDKYDKEERDNEIKKIDALLEVETYGTHKYFELQTRRNKLLLENQKDAADKLLKSTKDTNKKIFDDYDKLVKALIDKAIELSRKRQQEDEKQVENQKSRIATQQALAAQGLTNTLAFEQKMLAKRELELAKEQRKEERLQKIKALYGAYTNYADRGDKDALLKALRDFGILEGIAASLGKGGAIDDVVKEKVPTDGRGIIRGASHKGNRGGIAVRVEGREGIFSTREMSNLGKQNFYAIKEAAGHGKIDENFFGRQRREFVQSVVPVGMGSDKLISELRDVKKAIENKPTQFLSPPEFLEGVLKMTETLTSKNKVSRNHYRTRKPRP